MFTKFNYIILTLSWSPTMLHRLPLYIEMHLMELLLYQISSFQTRLLNTVHLPFLLYFNILISLQYNKNCFLTTCSEYISTIRISKGKSNIFIVKLSTQHRFTCRKFNICELFITKKNSAGFQLENPFNWIQLKLYT